MNNQWLEYSDPEKTTNEPVNTKSSFDAPPGRKNGILMLKDTIRCCFSYFSDHNTTYIFLPTAAAMLS